MNGLGRIAAAAACAAAAVAVPNLAYAKTAPSCPLPTFGSGSSYHPAIHPSDFSADVTNRWFPLRPGTTYLYTGTKDGKKALDVFQVPVLLVGDWKSSGCCWAPMTVPEPLPSRSNAVTRNR